MPRECYKENLQRFKIKGSSFEPVRAKSAVMSKASHKVPTRPHTAFTHRRASQKDMVGLADVEKGTVIKPLSPFIYTLRKNRHFKRNNLLLKHIL